MCGIAGFWETTPRTPTDELSAVVRSMADAMVTRGPDDSGTWVDQEAGIALGQRRLSIIDLSPLGHQPMTSLCGRYVVVFNGEIYNYQELRAELEGGGEPFRGHSDTEVLLTATSRWGIERTLGRLNGMFAFALWDRKERALSLARDRFGEKPLYYGWLGATFTFCSELKALHRHPQFSGELFRDALIPFLRHGYVPAPHSIYRGVYKLDPGTFLRVGRASLGAELVPTRYWSAVEVAARGLSCPFTGTVDEAVTELDALLRQAVKSRMVADVPLGAFLSGGIDSSTVVALMQAQSARPVKTFSIGFKEAGFDEAVYARRVAAHLGTDHTELYVSPEEARDVIPILPTLYDEPFADSSQIPTFLVAKLARQSVTVSLSGDAGDEVFGGYNRYFVGRALWRLLRLAPGSVREKAAALAAAFPTRAWAVAYNRVSELLPARVRLPNAGDKFQKLAALLGVKTADDLYVQLISLWTQPEAVVLGGTAPPTVVGDRSRWPALPDMVDRMMCLDTLSYLPDDILVKVDRATMGVSLEGRVPFLDHRVVEFAWRLPLAAKMRFWRGKRILRQVLGRYVPNALFERPKMGFGVPIDSWLRGPLREWAESLLSESRLRSDGFFDPGAVRTRWAEHLRGGRNWQLQLWVILMFQCWQDRWTRGVTLIPAKRPDVGGAVSIGGSRAPSPGGGGPRSTGAEGPSSDPRAQEGVP